MIQAVVFDMDGLLIDSEPFWQEAEIEVFAKVGLRLTHEMCTRTIGMRVDEVVKFWYDRSPWDLDANPLQELVNGIIDRVIYLINEKGEALPGVHQALQFFVEKKMRIALASSSSYRLIDAVLQKLEIADQFEAVHSAQDEKYGKPHPATFLGAADKLAIAPDKCLALEDSLFGVLAAKSAKMSCIAVPEPRLLGDPRFVIADLVLPTLAEFSQVHWQQLNQK